MSEYVKIKFPESWGPESDIVYTPKELLDKVALAHLEWCLGKCEGKVTTLTREKVGVFIVFELASDAIKYKMTCPTEELCENGWDYWFDR